MFARGHLAAILATALSAAPVLAQQHTAGPPATRPLTAEDRANLAAADFADEVDAYSEAHPVVAIGISKGRKDNITGEKIGQTLADVLRKRHGVPSKYFLTEMTDYSVIIFAVKGHVYGPYTLKESLSGLVLAADSFDEKVRSGVFPAPDPTEYPRPATIARGPGGPDPINH